MPSPLADLTSSHRRLQRALRGDSEARALRRTATSSKEHVLLAAEEVCFSGATLRPAVSTALHTRLLEFEDSTCSLRALMRARSARFALIANTSSASVLLALTLLEEQLDHPPSVLAGLYHAVLTSRALELDVLRELAPLTAINLVYELQNRAPSPYPASWGRSGGIQLVAALHLVANLLQHRLSTYGELLDVLDASLDMSHPGIAGLLITCVSKDPGSLDPADVFLEELAALHEPDVQDLVSSLIDAGATGSASDLAAIAHAHLLERR